MIAYLPYSHIHPDHLERLCEHFPGLLVYLPGESTISDTMRRLSRQHMLDIRLPRSVDGQRLLALVNDYFSWARMHGRGLGDLKAYLQTYQGRHPLVDDTLPTQIENQIRNFGRTSSSQGAEPCFQAALFLSLAHILDEQQASLETELDTVRRTEQRMYAVLSGKESPAAAAQAVNQAGSDASRILIPERIRAWATLAGDDSPPAWAYVATARSVIDELLEIFPDHVRLTGGYLVGPGAAASPGRPDFPALLKRAAFETTLKPFEGFGPADREALADPKADARWILYGLPHCPPPQALARMRKARVADGDHLLKRENPPFHTLLIWVDGM